MVLGIFLPKLIAIGSLFLQVMIKNGVFCVSQCIQLNFLNNLYISKKYIFYEHIQVCCGCDIIVIYDVIDCQIKTIRSVRANNIES